MTVALATSVRNARLDAIRDALDAGSGAAKLRIYTASRPATGAAITSQTLLAELELANPSAPNASGGVLTLTTSFSDPTANATGTAAWARLVDSDENFVADLTVTATGGGGDVTFATVSFVAAQTITITSATITEGNA